MPKDGDLRIDVNGGVYIYVEGIGWKGIGQVPVEGSVPSVGPAIATFEPGDYPVQDIGSELLRALWPETDVGQAAEDIANIPDSFRRVAAERERTEEGEGSGTLSSGMGGIYGTGRLTDWLNLSLVNQMSDAMGIPPGAVTELLVAMERTPSEVFSETGGADSAAESVAEFAMTPMGQSVLAQYGMVGADEDNVPNIYERTGAGGAGAAAAGEAAGIDWPPGALFTFARSLLQPGGAGTAGDYYSAISDVATPLTGADELDFLNRFAQPGQYYPGSFYTMMNKALMPMGMNMPDAFYGMMEAMWPSGFAPGYQADFSGLESLGQAPMPELGSFLASLIQGNPELGVALMEAAIEMQQEYAAPYLPLLMGPAATEGGGISGPDFLAAMLGGLT